MDSRFTPPACGEALFGTTIFVSAFLLFSVEPLVAKRILPWFGGSAAVWSTCLVFYQTALLVGYLYARLLTRYCKSRTCNLRFTFCFWLPRLFFYRSAPANVGSQALFRIRLGSFSACWRRVLACLSSCSPQQVHYFRTGLLELDIRLRTACLRSRISPHFAALLGYPSL